MNAHDDAITTTPGPPFSAEQVAADPILAFFGYAHLPPRLAEISECFSKMALWMITVLPRNAERTVALRKLLESKDCAVRAALSK